MAKFMTMNFSVILGILLSKNNVNGHLTISVNIYHGGLKLYLSKEDNSHLFLSKFMAII